MMFIMFEKLCRKGNRVWIYGIISSPVTEIEDFERVPELLILRMNNLTCYRRCNPDRSVAESKDLICGHKRFFAYAQNDKDDLNNDVPELLILRMDYFEVYYV